MNKRPVAVVTGAAGELGRELVPRLASSYDVVAVKHRRGLDVDTQHQSHFDPFTPSSRTEPRVFEVTADLKSGRDRGRLCEITLARYGRVDLLVNGAGVHPPFQLLSRSTPTAWPDTFAVNALAPILLAKELAEQAWQVDLASTDLQPCVVNCSAAASFSVDPERDAPLFAASKAALNVLSGHLAAELQHIPVRVNTIAPAPFPEIVATADVADAIEELIRTKETGRILAVWPDGRDYVV